MTSSTDGPDQGDPAAPIAYAAYGSSTGALRYLTEDEAEADEHARGGYRVVPLGPFRAPGAVAAAPPGDEDRRAAHQDKQIISDALGYIGGAYIDATLAAHEALDRLTRPAPPAGHEDEAAVERAARAACDVYGDWFTVMPSAKDEWRNVARAALAAARGPRTPDGPATN